MSTGDDDRDETLLDRLNNIVEEGDEESESIAEEYSLEADIFFGEAGQEGDDDSMEEEEEDDYDEDAAPPMDYQWEQRVPEEGSDSASYTSDLQFSALSFDDLAQADDSVAYDATSVGTSVGTSEGSSRRPSFSAQTSINRNSGSSVHSAPLRRLSPMPTAAATRRRVSINVPMNSPQVQSAQARTAASTRRRKSVSYKHLASSSQYGSRSDDEESSASSIRMSTSGRLFSRNGRRTSYGSSVTSAFGGRSHTSYEFDSMDHAMSNLDQGGAEEWESVVAAAAVVAAGVTSGNMRSHTQFAVDDNVLVFLNVLNHTNSVDSRDVFTVNPVNKYGFPRGEGKTTQEQHGPYVYVLAAVKKVHFDEDVRYYTVARADCGTEQRADTAWMEPIKSPIAVEAATRAAQQTTRSELEKETCEKEVKVSNMATMLKWPVVFANDVVKPRCRSAKKKAKEHVELILYGRSPYSCQLRATSVNLLVCCSATYVFLEALALAFFPPSSDFAVAVVEATVWSILALELLLEWMVRPPDYSALIRSEKAYAPSTSRNINSFHLFFESLSLASSIPGFICLRDDSCSQLRPFTGLWASICALIGPTTSDACLGRFYIGIRSLRMFALVRHWKIMRLNRSFSDGSHHSLFATANEELTGDRRRRSHRGKMDDEQQVDDTNDRAKNVEKASAEEDHRLKKAATIGTSLMVVNSQTALFLLTVIVTVLPMIGSIAGFNPIADEMTDLLQQNNIQAINCEHLQISVNSWLHATALVLSPSPLNANKQFLLWAQISPSPRGCAFLNGTNGVVTTCSSSERSLMNDVCAVWEDIAPPNPNDATPQYFADRIGVREGGIIEYSREYTGLAADFFSEQGTNPFSVETNFTVRVLFNQNEMVSYTNFSSFLLLLSSLILCLLGMTVLNDDAGRLVLNPLRRMLKIVVRYAENPLSQAAARKTRYKKKSSKDKIFDGGDDDSDGDRVKAGDKEQLGNYETEQLINAITKIADLLRKCWGVAGAGIISSNLARTQDGTTVVFNPTVPGKQVYALFGFVTINGFSDQLRALDRDVMILINDVAAVVHDEVFRWALGDSGQCNKNLGSSFLMVFRIGDFKEVHEKQARATDVVFSSTEKRNKKTVNLRRRKVTPAVQHGRGARAIVRPTKQDVGRGVKTLQLASLPGIQTFSDRALLGMLKSFAGILRDNEVTKWKRDFRLGAGVGAYVVNIIIGMDAGWAVEGAVGSEYKIDATYLSPHVNMAARMMSATKQYGVTILLSQAVEELLSSTARSKLRHLDTVYVKGSSVSQRIFTYDARHHGVDFFLFERSPEQSDLDAESYSHMIWETDQDLRAMRQHITEEFFQKFKEGKDLYLAGDWKEAIAALRDADDIMITHVLEEGYIDYNPDAIDQRIFDRNNTTDEIMRIRAELGDGPCKCLISYMEKRNATPPSNWKGVRPLTSK